MFEQLHSASIINRDRSVGDSPTCILCCCKGGRLAHIDPVLLQRRASRPHSSCVAAKEGESPSFILCGCKGGRLAHIHPVWLQRRATRPHASCVAAKIRDRLLKLLPRASLRSFAARPLWIYSDSAAPPSLDPEGKLGTGSLNYSLNYS